MKCDTDVAVRVTAATDKKNAMVEIIDAVTGKVYTKFVTKKIITEEAYELRDLVNRYLTKSRLADAIRDQIKKSVIEALGLEYNEKATFGKRMDGDG